MFRGQKGIDSSEPNCCSLEFGIILVPPHALTMSEVARQSHNCETAECFILFSDVVVLELNKHIEKIAQLN